MASLPDSPKNPYSSYIIDDIIRYKNLIKKLKIAKKKDRRNH